ncbi:MAG: sugar ABC transporter permease [Desulfurococcales archaeon]|nr:sugar ABC transporter permease [Desulfurococcales archaeon]
MSRRTSLTPYLLIAPALGYMLFMVGYPLVEAIYLSFFEDGGLTLRHINYLLYDPLSKFDEAVRNTFLLIAIIVPAETILAIVVAVFLYKSFRGRDMLVYMVAIPLTISDVASGLIWYSIFAGNGFLNKTLYSLGLIDSPIQFLGYEYKWREVMVVAIAEIWRSMAIVFVILFAGLQLLGKDLLEAAEVFGASWWQRVRHIILPMLKPSLQSALIIRTLFAFQIFGVVMVLTGRDIPVLAGEAYWEYVELRNREVSALYALIIAGLSLAFGFFYIRMLRAKFLEVGR